MHGVRLYGPVDDVRLSRIDGVEAAEFYACCHDEPASEAYRLSGRPYSDVPTADSGTPWCSVLEWARCGAMSLTGRADGPPLAPRAPVATRMLGTLNALTACTGQLGLPVRIELSTLLTWRARLNGWTRRGSLGLGGSCRMMATKDGWVALNLARLDDEELVRLMLGSDWLGEVGGRTAEDVVSLLSELGVPVAAVGAEAGTARSVDRIGEPVPVRGRGDVPTLMVVDLSSMWAGPLCAKLLGQSGLSVVKVEDVHRPDGSRAGSSDFYEWLHAGKSQVVLDFARPGSLAELIDRADVVIESSRPRAMRNLGIIAEDWVAARPGRTWVSITGYGRGAEHRVAFGDDAAAAGGLVAFDTDGPTFCADAIGDPLTGVQAAIAACRSVRRGGGDLVDISMAGVCAEVARPTSAPALRHTVRRVGSSWEVRHGHRRAFC